MSSELIDIKTEINWLVFSFWRNNVILINNNNTFIKQKLLKKILEKLDLPSVILDIIIAFIFPMPIIKVTNELKYNTIIYDKSKILLNNHKNINKSIYNIYQNMKIANIIIPKLNEEINIYNMINKQNELWFQTEGNILKNNLLTYLQLITRRKEIDNELFIIKYQMFIQYHKNKEFVNKSYIYRTCVDNYNDDNHYYMDQYNKKIYFCEYHDLDNKKLNLENEYLTIKNSLTRLDNDIKMVLSS